MNWNSFRNETPFFHSQPFGQNCYFIIFCRNSVFSLRLLERFKNQLLIKHRLNYTHVAHMTRWRFGWRTQTVLYNQQIVIIQYRPKTIQKSLNHKQLVTYCVVLVTPNTNKSQIIIFSCQNHSLWCCIFFFFDISTVFPAMCASDYPITNLSMSFNCFEHWRKEGSHNRSKIKAVEYLHRCLMYLYSTFDSRFSMEHSWKIWRLLHHSIFCFIVIERKLKHMCAR